MLYSGRQCSREFEWFLYSVILSSSSVLSVLSGARQCSPALQCSPVLSVLSSALQLFSAISALRCSPATFKTTPQRSYSRKRLGLSHSVALHSAPICKRMYILGLFRETVRRSRLRKLSQNSCTLLHITLFYFTLFHFTSCM